MGRIHPGLRARFQVRLASALLLAAPAWAAAPSYTAANVVNASNYAPAPFAPNSILTLFGTDLAMVPGDGGIAGSGAGVLPIEISGVQVFLDNVPTALFYVSPGQINFLVPANQTVGDMKVQVSRQAVLGPAVMVTVVDASPALFVTAAGLAIATHADNSLIAPGAPAHPGEIVVLYLTGLGQTDPRLVSGTLPLSAAQIVHQADLKILLDGAALDPARVIYAGVTPRFAGLYQINFALPGKVGDDPEIRVSVGAQSSPAGVRLPVR